MKHKVKLLKVAMLSLLMFSLFLTPVDAATKLNHSKVTLCRYHSCNLKIVGNKKPIKWKTSNKDVVTVDKKGKITAVTAGKATVTAIINKKKYNCSVTVKDYDTNTILAAYGYQALLNIIPDPDTLNVKQIWKGSTVANIEFGMIDCTFKDQYGKQVHAYVYIYEQDEKSSSCFNIQTSYSEKPMVVKFEYLEMDSVQKTRCQKGLFKQVKEAKKSLVANEKITVTKGKNFDIINNWLVL